MCWSKQSQRKTWDHKYLNYIIRGLAHETVASFYTFFVTETKKQKKPQKNPKTHPYQDIILRMVVPLPQQMWFT